MLTYAGVGSLRPHEISAIQRTSPSSQIAVVSTLVAALLLPRSAGRPED